MSVKAAPLRSAPGGQRYDKPAAAIGDAPFASCHGVMFSAFDRRFPATGARFGMAMVEWGRPVIACGLTWAQMKIDVHNMSIDILPGQTFLKRIRASVKIQHRGHAAISQA